MQYSQDVSRRAVRVLRELTGGGDALIDDVSDYKMAPSQGKKLLQGHHDEDRATCGYKNSGGLFCAGQKGQLREYHMGCL